MNKHTTERHAELTKKIAEFRKVLGSSLFKAVRANRLEVARSLNAAYKFVESVKCKKKLVKQQAADYCFELAKTLGEVRAVKNKFRSTQAAPKPQMLIRLFAFKKSNFKKWLKKAGYKIDLSGNTTINIDFGSPAKISAGTSYGARYSKKCFYRKKDLHIQTTIPTAWNTITKGMKITDGMLNLDLQQVGDNVWKAVWVEQGRSADSLNSVSGYICKDAASGEYAHGDTENEARITLKRRLSGRRSVETKKRHEKQIKDALALIRTRLETGNSNGESNVVVSIQDSFKAGNCPAGTRDWVNRYFAGRETATIAEIIKIEDRRRFAVSACLQAIRRQKVYAGVC